FVRHFHKQLAKKSAQDMNKCVETFLFVPLNGGRKVLHQKSVQSVCIKQAPVNGQQACVAHDPPILCSKNDHDRIKQTSLKGAKPSALILFYHVQLLQA